MDTNVKFAKVKEGARVPSKRDEDMAFDIYACFDQEYMVIEPHETELIPTGIASACHLDYGFLLRERGSTGTRGIALRAGVIDSGFRGEWFVVWNNTTDYPVYLSKLTKEELIQRDMKNKLEDSDKLYAGYYWEDAIVYPYEKAIAQALVIPVPQVTVEEIPYDNLIKIYSIRGTGALGSSGK